MMQVFVTILAMYMQTTDTTYYSLRWQNKWLGGDEKRYFVDSLLLFMVGLFNPMVKIRLCMYNICFTYA
jgi:hypothetical protein